MKRDYLSVSALKAFNRSPNHYIQYLTGSKVASPAMAFGSALHCAVLEPEEFDKRYAIAPKFDKRTKAGKAAHEAFVQAAGEREVVGHADYERLVLVKDAVHRCEPAMKILSQAMAFEQVRTVPIGGVPFKGIADIVGPNFVADLKTAQDGSPNGFQRSAANLHYHLQAAAYRRLWGVGEFYWVVVETQAPWNVVVYKQDDASNVKADAKLLNLINAWTNWDGRPASYADDVLTLSLPSWA